MVQRVSLPAVIQANIISAQTAASGTGWVAFPDNSCTHLEIVNTTGTAIEYRRNGGGSAIAVQNNASRMIHGIDNASDIEVRRVDTSVTQVTVVAEAFR